MRMLSNLYGSALPARMQLDKQILSRCLIWSLRLPHPQLHCKCSMCRI